MAALVLLYSIGSLVLAAHEADSLIIQYVVVTAHLSSFLNALFKLILLDLVVSCLIAKPKARFIVHRAATCLFQCRNLSLF